MVYSHAWGKLIHEKNQKSKISWHCPFKGYACLYLKNWVNRFSNIYCKSEWSGSGRWHTFRIGIGSWRLMFFWLLTRIPTPYRVYLIDTGKEGRARDSRPPQPHPQVDLFSLVGAASPSSVSRPRVARGYGPGGGWGAGRGGGVRGVSASHPVNRAYTHNILQFSYFLLGNEPIRGSHFSIFLHILSLKQYNGWISIKSIKTKIILY